MTLAIVADPITSSVGTPVEADHQAAAATVMPRTIQTEADLACLLSAVGGVIKAVLVRRFPSLSAADAEDVLSVALHRVWMHRTSFNPDRSSLRSWFFCIAHRAAIDVLKVGWQKARQLECPLENAEFPSVISDENGAEEASAPVSGARAARHAALHESLAELPDVQRQILWADALGAAAGGVSSETLGRELGLPAGTVRVYRKRALERLRAALQKRIPDFFSHGTAS